jgi:DHA3 family macrolide efflux protein-like MFS transporter
MPVNRPVARGLRAFTIIWLGQVVSLCGSALSSFAVGVWVYQKTGSATQFALIALFAMLPGLLLAPLAGALLDRFDRRALMLLADSGAGLATLSLALLLWAGRLDVWHVYVVVAISRIFDSLKVPALSASTTLIVPKAQLPRASGMAQVGPAVAQIVGPVIAGALLVLIGLEGVVVIDFATFLVAAATILPFAIPRPAASAAGSVGRGSLWREALSGWAYIRERPGLLGLLAFFAGSYFSLGMVQVLLTPLVLSFTTPAVLGTVLSVATSGLLISGLAISVWGVPRQRVRAILVCTLMQGLFLFAGGFRPSAVLVTVGAFVVLCGTPVVRACSEVLWQTRVEPDIQGRVFAIRRMIGGSTLPLAALVAGPLADHVFDPLLLPGGALAGNVGRLIGVGKGRGIGLLFMVLGLLTVVTVGLGFLSPRLRRLEVELPEVIPDELAAPATDLPAAADPSVSRA